MCSFFLENQLLGVMSEKKMKLDIKVVSHDGWSVSNQQWFGYFSTTCPDWRQKTSNFSITDRLWVEFTGDWWFPLTEGH